MVFARLRRRHAPSAIEQVAWRTAWAFRVVSTTARRRAAVHIDRAAGCGVVLLALGRIARQDAAGSLPQGIEKVELIAGSGCAVILLAPCRRSAGGACPAAFLPHGIPVAAPACGRRVRGGGPDEDEKDGAKTQMKNSTPEDRGALTRRPGRRC